jgi:hypothetical protein
MAVDPTNASNLSSGSVPLAQLGNAPATDTTAIEDDIALLGFKVAIAGSMAKYNLVDQTEDAFVDQTGIDTGASTSQGWNAGKYFSGVTAGNYFGDDSDGAVTISTDTNEIVLNKSGSYDGDMLVKNYSSLTIDASNTLTIDQPARGMLVYVSGNCTINGTLSMTARGAFANPTIAGGSDSSAVSATGLRLPLLKSGSTDVLAAADFAGTGNAAVAAVANQAGIDGNGKIYTVGRTGGAGGASSTISGAGAPSNPGTSGTATLSTGGGGSGGGYSEGLSLYIGGGATGSVFSGGPGGGGAYASSGSMTVAGDGVAYGGAGGQGGGTVSVYGVKAGGAGNPGGVSAGGASMNGNDGTGGLLILIVGGDLTIGGSGSIVAGGAAGGNSVPGGHSGLGGGGGSGGGKILALYAGTLSNSGTIAASGGGGGGGGSTARTGNAGGDGHVVTEVIDVAGSLGANMTLVSNATTANDGAPTKGDIVMTYTNGAGTATLNTDLTAEFSANDGVAWTPMTLVAQGTTGSASPHFIVSAHNVTLTTASGTAMRYRIKTLNQSVSKITRIQAVSLGWS